MRFVGAALAATLLAGVAQASTFALPKPDESVVGELSRDITVHADTLVDVAKRNRLGYEELALANPAVDRWLPGEGTNIVLPTRFLLPQGPRTGIVVNLAEFRLYYYPKPRRAKEKPVVETFAVGAGRDDWRTPEAARTHVSRRLQNPAWYPPLTIRMEHEKEGRKLPAMVPPGPDNPLGALALKLAIPGGYFIHGTSRPFGIGMKVTHGCLRLYPEDMERLFKLVPEGTPVRVVHEPYKTGWKDGMLYLEAHPPIDEGGNLVPADLAQITAVLRAAAARQPGYEIDWSFVESLALQPRGIPMPIPRAQAAAG